MIADRLLAAASKDIELSIIGWIIEIKAYSLGSLASGGNSVIRYPTLFPTPGAFKSNNSIIYFDVMMLCPIGSREKGGSVPLKRIYDEGGYL